MSNFTELSEQIKSTNKIGTLSVLKMVVADNVKINKVQCSELLELITIQINKIEKLELNAHMSNVASVLLTRV